MSAKLGIPTVDIGAPQLSMHSIREMCCTSSVSQAICLYKVKFITSQSKSGHFLFPL